MATASQTVPALLTLEEYLRTTYRPDCEFVDGHLEERNLGTPKHALLQMELGLWFGLRRKEWKIRTLGDVRTRTSPTRVRLPDVAIVSKHAAQLDPPWITTPPLIAIEILSPEDRMKRVLPRLKEFRVIGVPNVWLLDPIKRTASIYTERGLQLAEGPASPCPTRPSTSTCPNSSPLWTPESPTPVKPPQHLNHVATTSCECAFPVRSLL